MQTTFLTRVCSAALALVAVLLACPNSATAQSFWDPAGTAASPGSGGNGSWDNTTADWWVSGVSDTNWIGNNIAFFEGTNGTVTLNANETADGLTFTANGYVLTGGSTLTLAGASAITVPSGVTTIDCALAGTTGLNLSGPGTLALGAANVYTGTTAIGAGSTLTITNSGGLVAGGLITNNGAFVYNSSAPQTLAAAISGPGTLTQSGPGTLTLSTANSYSGGTTITGGILAISAVSQLGQTSGNKLAFNGGALQMSSASFSYAGAITVNTNGGTITLKGETATLTGLVSGPGNLSTSGDDFIIAPTGANSVSNFTQTAGNRVFLNTAGALGVSPNFVTIHMAGATGSVLDFQDTAPANPLNPMYFASGSSLTARNNGGYPGLTVSTTNAFFPTTGIMVFNRDSGSSGTATQPIVINGNYPTLTGPLTIDLGGGTGTAVTGPVTLNGVLTDAGSNYTFAVTQVDGNSPGKFILNGTNTYTGNTTVNSGTLVIGTNGDLGDNGLGTGGLYAGEININGTLSNASSFPQTWSGQIGGSGALVQGGAGTLILNNNNDSPSSIVVAGGVLQLGDGVATNGDLTSGSVTVTSPGVLAFNNPQPDTFAQTISGTGEVNMRQAGAVEAVSGSISASTTLISAGTLALNGGTISSATIAIAPGATFDVSSSGSFTLSSSSTLSASGATLPATLNGASGGSISLGAQPIALTYNGTNLPLTITFSSGAPGTLMLNGNVFLVSNTGPALAAGSYPLLQLASGTVIVPSSGTLPATVLGNGLLSAADDAVVQINAGTVSLVVQTSHHNTPVWNGAGFNSNPNWSNPANWVNSTPPDSAGDVVVFTGNTGLTPVMDSSYNVFSLTFDSNTTGSFTLDNSGGTVLSVTAGVNNNSSLPQTLDMPVQLIGVVSPWSISNSAASITVNAPVGDTGNGLALTGGGTLNLNGNNTFTGPLSSTAGGTVNITGDLGDQGSGNASYAGAITANGAFTYSGGAQQTLSGPITANGPFIDNNSSGQTLSGSLTIGTNGSFTDNSSGPQTLSGPISDNGSLVINNTSGANMTLPGLISGSGSLTDIGILTLTLGNPANNYAGGTTVNGSTAVLSIGADGCLGTGPLTLANGAELKSTGTIVDTRLITLSPGSSTGTAGSIAMSGGNFSIYGTVTGGGGLSISGSEDFVLVSPSNNNIGVLTDTASRAFFNTPGCLGAGTNLAVVYVNAGLFIFQSNAPTAPLNQMTFVSGTGLTARGTPPYTSLTVNTANVTFPSSGTMILNYDEDATLTGPIIINGNWNLSGDLTIQLGGANASGGLGTVGTVTLNGAINDGGSGADLFVTAPGVSLGNIFLNGTNSYSGNTTISAGGFTIGGSGCLGVTAGATNYAGNITVNGALTNATSANQIWSGSISGTGPLTQSGSGTLTLTSGESYNGPTTISGGTLALGAGGSISATSAISIGAGATFDVTGADPYTWNSGTTLSASGAASPATIKDSASGATINLGLQPISLTYDGSHPALTILGGTLVLNSNAFTVNTASPLASGAYAIVHQASGSISSAGTYSVSGTALGVGATGTISVSGGNVNLVIVAPVPPTPTITSVSVKGTTLTITATNGAPSGAYVLLQSTNLALRLSQWTPVMTNSFNAGGDINLSTNIVNPGVPQEFYILEQAQ